MQVYCYDVDGVFISQEQAQESPLEPGVWLLPARSTTIAPPSVSEGQQAVWNGAVWEVRDVPAVSDPNDDALPDIPEDPALAEAIVTATDKLLAIGLSRYEITALFGI